MQVRITDLEMAGETVGNTGQFCEQVFTCSISNGNLSSGLNGGSLSVQ